MTLRKANLIFAVLLIAFAVWVISNSFTFRDPRTGQIPLLLATLLLLSAGAILVLNLVPRTGRLAEQERPFLSFPWIRWIMAAGLLGLYGFGTVAIGFYESGFLFLTLTSFMLSAGEASPGKRLLACAIFGLAATAVLYVAFSVILGIPLPSGILL